MYQYLQLRPYMCLSVFSASKIALISMSQLLCLLTKPQPKAQVHHRKLRLNAWIFHRRVLLRGQCISATCARIGLKLVFVAMVTSVNTRTDKKNSVKITYCIWMSRSRPMSMTSTSLKIAGNFIAKNSAHMASAVILGTSTAASERSIGTSIWRTWPHWATTSMRTSLPTARVRRMGMKRRKYPRRW